jgi:hypothetical protein
MDLLARWRYRIDRLLADGARGKLILLIGLSLALLALGAGAGLVGLFAEANRAVPGVTRDLDGGLLDALWWSFHHLLDPSFFAESYGATWPVVLLSLLVALGGLVVFGLLVGFVSAEVEERLERLRQGDGPVAERGHALVLGWSDRAVPVIAMLAREGTVAVLSPRPAEDMRNALAAAGLGPLLRRVVLRSGRPDRNEDLQRVGAGWARCCVVLPEDGDDAAAARTVLLCCRRKRVAVEVADPANADLLTMAGGGRVPVVAAARVTGSLLLQASRQSGIVEVHQLLLDPARIGFRFLDLPEAEGLRFGDAAFAFPGAVLVGTSAVERLPSGDERYAITLNPPPHRRIQRGEWLVVLAPPGPVTDRRSDPAWRGATQDLRAQREDAAGTWSNSVFSARLPLPVRQADGPRHQVLILGWNPAIADLLAGYDAAHGPQAVVVVASRFHSEAAKAELLRLGLALRRLKPRFVTCDLADGKALAALQPEAYACILALREGEAGGDAATTLLLIRLRALLRRNSNGTRLVAELADGESAEALRAIGAEVVTGSEAAGRQLVLVAEQTSLAQIYDDLLDASGCEVYLKPPGRYLPEGASATFADLVVAAQQRRETALGVRRSDGRIELAPAKDTPLMLSPTDRVIVLAEDLLDDEMHA